MNTDSTCEDCAGTGTEWVGNEYIPSSGKDIPCRTCNGSGQK